MPKITMASSMSIQKMSTPADPILQTLPVDLRNVIYEYVVLEDSPVTVVNEQQPSIALTCREIREECLSVTLR